MSRTTIMFAGCVTFFAWSCAAPAPDNALLPQEPDAASAAFEQVPTVPRSEDPMATRSLRKEGKNTYASSCGPMAKAFDATPFNARIAKRIENVPARQLAEPSMISPPIPSDFPPLTTSVICRVAFDVSPEGIPVEPVAQCTDAAFEPAAEGALREARFEPVPYSGLIMPMEFCRND